VRHYSSMRPTGETDPDGRPTFNLTMWEDDLPPNPDHRCHLEGCKPPEEPQSCAAE
jgi:hypothetical protein